jgi:hypothetical protein
MNDVF